MTAGRGVRALPGVFVPLSLALCVQGGPRSGSASRPRLTAFVGANPLRSALTGFCPAHAVLRELGVRDGASPAPAP